MQSINTALVFLSIILLAVIPVTIAVNHDAITPEFAINVWVWNLLLQIVGLILVIITFFRPVAPWMRLMHSLYLLAITIFYSVFFYAMAHAADGINISFGSN